VTAKPIQFTKDDVRHALLGVIPAFVLVATGHLKVGGAFAIGLLPSSLMGIAPTRKLRLIYGAVGCLFGVGVLVGSAIINLRSVALAALMLFAVSYAATMIASRRPAGGLLLSIVVPSIAVGTGYAVHEALGLMVAFIAGSIWSALVSMAWREFPPDPHVRARLQALQPSNPHTYGVLLGLAAATAIVVGHAFDIPYAGWIATAAMLVMRPLHEMTGLRGVGRAGSTIIGTLLVVATIELGLGHLATAFAVAIITIITIGARTSRWYITSFGTAFLILTVEMFGITNSATVHDIGVWRIMNNVIGAAVALFYGLLVPQLLARRQRNRVA
jgi:hypothetical protein